MGVYFSHLPYKIWQMIFRVAQNSSTNAPFGVLILFSYRELAAPYGEALTLATRDAVPYESS